MTGEGEKARHVQEGVGRGNGEGGDWGHPSGPVFPGEEGEGIGREEEGDSLVGSEGV